MIFIGIDPGKRGAVAMLEDGRMNVYDYPKTLSECIFTIQDWQTDDMIAAVESPIFGHGGKTNSTAIGKLCKNQGEWCGLLAGLGIPYQEVAPQTWGKILTGRARGKKLKDKVRDFTTKMYANYVLGPKGGFRDGRADAICIALWLESQYRTEPKGGEGANQAD